MSYSSSSWLSCQLGLAPQLPAFYYYWCFTVMFTVQHVLLKPEVKGLDGEVAGPPPQEPT